MEFRLMYLVLIMSYSCQITTFTGSCVAETLIYVQTANNILHCLITLLYQLIQFCHEHFTWCFCVHMYISIFVHMTNLATYVS